MSRRALLTAFALALVASLVMLWPLRLAPMAGLAATHVSGSIWHGRLVAAQWAGLSLGDIEVGLSPASLLRFSPRLSLSGAQVSGTLSADGVVGLNGRVRPLSPGLGELQLEALTLRFADGACQEAGGRVRLQQGGEQLAGVPRCAGAVAELAMARPDGMVMMTLQLTGGGLGGAS